MQSGKTAAPRAESRPGLASAHVLACPARADSLHTSSETDGGQSSYASHLAATCGPKASSCVCCTLTTLHHRAKHVHHAVGAAVYTAAPLAYAQGHGLT